MPSFVHVALLITFTPDPPSTTHPCISMPCTRTLMARLRCSMIVGPRLVSVKRAGMVWCGICSCASIVYRNRGTKFKSLLIVSVIGQSARVSLIVYASATFRPQLCRILTPAASARHWLRWPLLPIPELLSLCHPAFPIPLSSLCSMLLLVERPP